MRSQNIRRSFSLLLAACVLPLAGATDANSPSPVHGDYVEVRTASVFAGACHYNGERVTEGRSAIMAWNIEGGSFAGVDLTGVRVVAAVVCDDNLAETTAPRHTIMSVDAADSARADSSARADAAVAWVVSRCGVELGSIASVTRSPIRFTRADDAYFVAAAGLAALSVEPMPDRACCTQPELVWYRPLMPILDPRVGYTVSATLQPAGGRVSWQRSDENSAFSGRFDR